MTAPITSFQGPYRWLSNFAPARVILGDLIFPSVEHAYQASKTRNLQQRERIRLCATPGEAKRLGRGPRTSDHREVMLGLLRQKFAIARSPYREKLIATGDAELIEGNNWGDTYWGVCRGKGENVLGKLIMQVRAELLAEEGL